MTHEDMAAYLRGEIETLLGKEAEARKEYNEALKRWQQIDGDLKAVRGMLDIVERDIASERAAMPSRSS